MVGEEQGGLVGHPPFFGQSLRGSSYVPPTPGMVLPSIKRWFVSSSSGCCAGGLAPPTPQGDAVLGGGGGSGVSSFFLLLFLPRWGGQELADSNQGPDQDQGGHPGGLNQVVGGGGEPGGGAKGGGDMSVCVCRSPPNLPPPPQTSPEGLPPTPPPPPLPAGRWFCPPFQWWVRIGGTKLLNTPSLPHFWPPAPLPPASLLTRQ